MPGTNWNPDTTQGKRGYTGILSTGWDGNYSTNYGMQKNARCVDHIHYGEEDMECPQCDQIYARSGDLCEIHDLHD